MGKIKLLRIDSRLSHGETVKRWCEKYGLENLIIANDRMMEDAFAREVMDLTIEKNIARTYLNVDQVRDFLETHGGEYFLLVDSSHDLKRLLDQGLDIENVNIGIMHLSIGKELLTEYIGVDAFDIEVFNLLLEKNIRTSARLSPFSEEIDLKDLLSKEYLSL
uniref:PTS sugar transporter subunit IIB n=1 Tax=Anaerococcus mediterraneensis TaxID=1870984 RepID=UPI0009318144|nr:PTS sugar transporter subunit IIB [Anaerococcus mediterraneensis]